jgi:membrane fusion protein, copper/silver efflux system
LGEQARTVKARITVVNTDGRLKPGMYATVVLNSSTQSALTVPRSAVVQTGERALVFVDLGNGKLNAQTVKLGRTGGDYVEVLSGLASGQRVVTSAQFLIDSESNVAEVMRSMIGVPGQGGATSKMTPGAKDALDAKGADMRGVPAISPPAKK